MSSSHTTENDEHQSGPASSTEGNDLDMSSESPEISTSIEPKYCLVMGRQYQIGDKLPHDTGNCLECICGMGAKVTCSPHQCSPAGDEINDYRMPGPRQPVPEMF
ncbi:unnamed protein product [Phaedon cochleariae]|uniref:VWFC domain-containing protein n=1 Tax=Phaedon cochleariae TaxID=80249 RepID=A0A9N9SPD0_PHACE|nr:unnamed protein product [Phaedon cochleariae]